MVALGHGSARVTGQFRFAPMRGFVMSFLRASIAQSVALLAIAAASPALAHPHVFVVVKSELVFNDKGLVTGVRHAWTFDDMYSSFVTTGLTADGKPPTEAQLQPLAEQNVGDLAEFGYFTVLKAPGQKIEIGKPDAISMSLNDKNLVTLRFTANLKTPASAGRALTFQVYDPTYFVSFDFDKNGVSLASAPSGCSLTLVPPKSLDDTESQKLSEAFFSGLSPGADFGIKLAGRAIVACP
jgi:ABC-type uncharacterized transport system substrate-binding protein